MKVSFHDPQTAEAEIMHSTGHGPFCTLDFRNDEGEVTFFLRAHQMNAARAIAAIFNGDIDAITARIDEAIQRAPDKLRVDIADTDLDVAIACDLIGKDLGEALRERREAEDAA